MSDVESTIKQTDETVNQTGGIIQRIESMIDGGLPRLLLSRPIQQALGRLISGMVNVPTAYFERFSQRVRDQTEAESRITAAVSTAASAIASKDERLVRRSLERWVRQQGDRQQTREEIALRTLEVLSEGDDPIRAAAPSEDFMRVFEDLAEKVSSDDLKDLMARILAGEIRNPGSVSRRTLQVVAVLDQEIVRTLTEIRPYLLRPGWMHIPTDASQAWQRRISLLNSVSITSEIGMRALHGDEHRKCTILTENHAIIITLPTSSLKFQYVVDGANLTPIGEELISVLPLGLSTSHLEVASGFKRLRDIKKVEIGDISSSDKGEHITNLLEIP